MDVPVLALCLPGIATGLRLAGVEVLEFDRVESGVHWLGGAIGTRMSQVLLVQEQIYAALTPDLRARLVRRPLPMIVPFPDPSWEALPEPAAYIVELLRQAIGYRVRLR